ncbi:MAG: 50S ribosomal protein L33 [Candidatus Berkelbacteria bacterium]|nr:50S ribosomal protein L33 [Candidatus Berkelbacteria bacterium]
MAKKGKRPRDIVLECSVCGNRNYVTGRSAQQPIKKLSLQKHCRKCRKHTAHKESK